jgi:hypothetical protein
VIRIKDGNNVLDRQIDDRKKSGMAGDRRPVKLKSSALGVNKRHWVEIKAASLVIRRSGRTRWVCSDRLFRVDDFHRLEWRGGKLDYRFI